MNITEKLKIDLSKKLTTKVTASNTAETIKSGTLPVYATPAMTALMEQAAAELIEDLLPDGWTSVGISMNIAHLAASPVGSEISATAKITAIDGRKISYEVVASDSAGPIGKGTHERFIVDKDKFLQKAQAKL